MGIFRTTACTWKRLALLNSCPSPGTPGKEACPSNKDEGNINGANLFKVLRLKAIACSSTVPTLISSANTARHKTLSASRAKNVKYWDSKPSPFTFQRANISYILNYVCTENKVLYFKNPFSFPSSIFKYCGVCSYWKMVMTQQKYCTAQLSPWSTKGENSLPAFSLWQTATVRNKESDSFITHKTRRQNDLSISSYLCMSNLPTASKLKIFYGQENRCSEWEKMAYSSREGRSENYETRNYCWIIQSFSTSFYSHADHRSN